MKIPGQLSAVINTLGYQTGYAPCFAALGGLTSLVGHAGEPPKGMNIRYGDSTVGAATAFAAIAALHHRASTGEGQFIDVSAVEAMSSMIGDSLFAYAATGEIPRADENRHPELSPHGCFPCANGEWISIAAANDQERAALFAILGEGDLALRTRDFDAETLADQLRKAGVAACKSVSSLDLIGDSFLWESGVYRLVDDSEGDNRPIIGPGWRMSPDEASITNAAPRLGEHNGYIYGELLARPTSEIDALVERSVIR